MRRLARRYADEILARSGRGPCEVLGHSYGAVVAHEVTRVLREHQVDVQRCVLLDCQVPSWRLLIGGQTVQERLAGDPIGGSRPKELAYVAHALSGRRPRAHRLTTERMHAATWGLAIHRLRPIDVPLLAVEAVDGAPGRDLSAWRRFTTAGFEVFRAPGDHHSMLTPPHVDVLADRLR